MNGSGTRISIARPVATIAPEKTTARPAVSIVRITASARSSPRSSSSNERVAAASRPSRTVDSSLPAGRLRPGGASMAWKRLKRSPMF